MANVVNVATTDTFEEWRVKTNEIGTSIGDIDELTVSGSVGYTNIVEALAAIVAGTATASSLVTLYDVSGTQVFPAT
jgi:hypothetical protein